MFKINVNQVLKALDGTELTMKEHECPKCKTIFGRSEDLTMRAVCLSALTNYRTKDDLEKLDRFRVALKVQENDEVSLNLTDAKMLHDCIIGYHVIPLAGRAIEILDPALQQPEESKKG